MSLSIKSPSLLVESICIRDGRVLALEYHQERLDRSRRELGFSGALPLAPAVQEAYRSWQAGEHPPAGGSDDRHPGNAGAGLAAGGVVKCRVLYDRSIQEIEFEVYKPRKFTACRPVESPYPLDYHLKYRDRSCFEGVNELVPPGICPLICRHGWLTDALHANIALLVKGEWLTPETPLLGGTMRRRLLEQKKIRPAALRREWLPLAERISLINALNPLDAQVLPLG
ncbi:aminotransferase class IV [Spirochaeta lutea]|uniref:hypothetical protein n=1 Tax=Spirochaeta lutea TaxID=1480694 RepID=UPI000A84AA08|nr:hypothetical protein [Spirochaeta lutea]